MKLFLDSTKVDNTASGSITMSYYGDAAKILLTGRIDELILKYPTPNNNYLIMDFIKNAVEQGILLPPMIKLESDSYILKKKFEKDIKEINKIWKETSA